MKIVSEENLEIQEQMAMIEKQLKNEEDEITKLKNTIDKIEDHNRKELERKERFKKDQERRKIQQLNLQRQ